MKLITINETIAVNNNGIKDKYGNTFSYLKLPNGECVCEYEQSVYFPELFKSSTQEVTDVELKELVV